MLAVHELYKSFGSANAIAGLSFTVTQGEIVGFLGPNGAGKTTTLRVLATALKPSAGTVQVAGHDVVRATMQVRRSIGYLPETPPLYDELTVEEYLRYVGVLKGLGRKGSRLAAAAYIERCQLETVSRQLCGTLSKGFRQRVGLAQALLHEPAVLLLDEPTDGLDPEQIVEFRKLIRSVARNKTVLISSHILSEVQALCDRILIMRRGKLVEDCTIADVDELGALESVYLQAVSEVPLAVPSHELLAINKLQLNLE
jgi:ABC-2 type transport system ATP-binding protein